MNKIFIIIANKKFYKIDKFKFEIDKFSKNKIRVEMHELIDFINPSFRSVFKNSLRDQRVKKFKNYLSWKLKIKKIIQKFKKENILIYNGIGIDCFKSFQINYFIKSELKLNVIETQSCEFPKYYLRQHNLKALLNLFLNFLIYPKKIYFFLKLQFFRPFYKLKNLNPKYLLVFGKKNEKEVKGKKNQKIIYGNGFDYNAHLAVKNLKFKIKEKDYAIFLESPTPIFSGDNQIYGVDKNFELNRNLWVRSLNKFFSVIEKETNLKVLISPHPKSKHKNNRPSYYEGRKILNNFALFNCRNAKLIISRTSTGSSYAAIHNIPIMFIYSNDIKKKPKLLTEIIEFAKHFGKRPINIDNFNINKLTQEIFKINKKKYYFYKKNFLTSLECDTKNSEVFLNLFNK